MSDWKRCKLSQNDTIRHALKIISDGSFQMGIVVDEEDLLIGIITDGDIRRELLKGITLEDELSFIINKHPTTGRYGTDKTILLRMMKDKGIQNLPIVDDNNRVVDVLAISNMFFSKKRNNLVVLMAGGLGARLRPLTDSCPKPLLRVGKKPILETILEGFISYGFYKFYFAVNYKSDMIENYFGDGNKFGVEIKYLHENERLGTAGALYLLPENVIEPIIVMNGDLLTKVDFGELLERHISADAEATMAIRECHYNIPYGVIDYDGTAIHGVIEKPRYEYFINAGIYVLSPKAVNRVNKKVYYDMPDLFKTIITEKGKVNGYLVEDYWLDIGRIDDFTRAQDEYATIFNI